MDFPRAAPLTGDKHMEDFVLICSVGGSPDPIRKSIDQQQPPYVIYLASPASRQTIRKDIDSALTWRDIKDTHTVTLFDYQDLLTCVKDMRAGISRALRDMSLPETIQLRADITGGTKVMSAALTLVMMEYPKSLFIYVGGDTRVKNGLGVVETGHEKILKQDNPWDVMALREVQSLANAFNRRDFATAHGTAKRLATHIPGDKKNFYGAIADLTESFLLWDAFDHKSARNKMTQALGRLDPFSKTHEPLQEQLRRFQECFTALENIQEDAERLRSSNKTLESDSGQAYLRDLLANALRRGEARRYDDAVARLYSAIEKSAKIRLQTRYNINNSNIAPEQLPEQLPKEPRQNLLSQLEKNGVIRIGLQHSFQLLAALGDPLGATYTSQETRLLRALEKRNASLLAHGYVPVDEKAYQDLREITFAMLEIDETALPHYPTLDWKSLLL